MAESRDWKMADRRRDDDLTSGVSDEEITGRFGEEDDEEFEDTEELEDDEDLEESER